MDNVWSLHTRGDPLGAVRNFIAKIWLEAGLDGMLMTMTSYGDSKATPSYITEVERINEFNPFNPLMEINAARVILVEADWW